MLGGRTHTKYFMKHFQRHKLFYAYLAAILLIILAVTVGILFGATRISLFDGIGSLISGEADSSDGRILLYVRLPRVLGGLLCGCALALSGAVLQGVLANKLASPSIIGVNSGAGLAVTLCAAFGIVGGTALSVCAFVGALVAVVLVSFGAKKWNASRSSVILMGVALNALLGAIDRAVVTFAPTVCMTTNDFKVGDLSSVTYEKLLPAAIMIAVGSVLIFTLSNELELLTLGDENARGLGLNASAVRAVFLLLCALLAGAAVSVTGLLSFVGLLVPHAVRRVSGSGAGHQLPLCALFGAGFVSLCDTLSRIIFAPYELPVGIIMAFIGAPFFLFILLNGKGGKKHA